MELYSESIEEGRQIPEQHAFGVSDREQRVTLGPNVSPHLAWTGMPAGTRSLVLICHDPDAPGYLDDVNREDRELRPEIPRVDFFHWILVDIAADLRALPAGAFSEGVTIGGKDGPEGPMDTRQGVNNFTHFLSGNKEMEGQYFGYDGPCPPWNDSIRHRYYFTLYALDVPRCPVEGVFYAQDVLEAIRPHVLDQAQMMGTYSLNPRVPA